MGSLGVVPAHEAAPISACVAATMQGPVVEDYLFCHELLCAEALDIHHDHEPSLSWHSLHDLQASSDCDYADHLSSSSWTSSPSLLHSWSSSFISSSSASIASASPSLFDDHHNLHCSLNNELERLTDSSAPCSCSKFSIASSACSASSDQISNDPVCMDNLSLHGELGSGSGSMVSAGGDEDNGCESMSVLLERQRWEHCRPFKLYAETMQQNVWCGSSNANSKHPHWASAYTLTTCRRRAVEWMLEVGRVMQVRLLSVAQAVAYLDRYLSHHLHPVKQAETCHVLKDDDIHMASVACLWIALKMEHSNAPDAGFMIQSLAGMFQYSREEGVATLKSMEERVLQVLAWRLLGVSSLDFVDSILSTFQTSSPTTPNSQPRLIPDHLIYSLQCRAYEIVQGTFLEVAFVRYEALVVGVCAIQHAVEEILPIQAGSIMKIIHKCVAISLDKEEDSKCYKAMGDLIIDPIAPTHINIASPISHNMIYNANTLL